MSRLTELASKLSPDQLREVEDFAEFLTTRAGAPNRPPKSRINVDALYGLCSGMGGDKSDKDVVRDGWNGVVDKLES
jgi:hypothetical protein